MSSLIRFIRLRLAARKVSALNDERLGALRFARSSQSPLVRTIHAEHAADIEASMSALAASLGTDWRTLYSLAHK